MIRLLIVALLASSSIPAAAELSNSTNSLFQASKKCNHCKPGPAGPPGKNGQNGANGPTGPTGPAGLASPNMILAYTSGDTEILRPINPPLLGSVIRVPFGGSPASTPLASNGPGTPTFIQPSIQHYAYNVSQDFVIVSMAGTFTLEDFVDEPSEGTEITPRMEIWVAPMNSNTFTPSGAGIDFPTLVVPANPSDLDNTTVTVLPTAVNVLIPAGTRILMLCSITATEDIRIRGICTGGISMSYP